MIDFIEEEKSDARPIQEIRFRDVTLCKSFCTSMRGLRWNDLERSGNKALDYSQRTNYNAKTAFCRALQPGYTGISRFIPVAGSEMRGGIYSRA